MHPRDLPFSVLAWTAALLPLVTTHASYLLAASLGHVDWCMPYWDACTSISATGRQLPEKLLFKLGMIPAATITALLWWCLCRWLQDSAAQHARLTRRSMVWLGILAAFFLILYTVALGEEGEAYQHIRRIGVTLAFAFTFLAQLLFTRLLGLLAEAGNSPELKRWHTALLALLCCLLTVGVTSVILDALLGSRYDTIEDAFEWVMALMLDLWFAGLAVLLTRQSLVIDISVDLEN